MNKSNLIDVFAEQTGYTRQISEAIVNEFFDAMVEAMERGDGIELRGFGSFSLRHYKSYIGRNPKTGERIEVAPKTLPFFKVGKELKERVMARTGT